MTSTDHISGHRKKGITCGDRRVYSFADSKTRRKMPWRIALHEYSEIAQSTVVVHNVPKISMCLTAEIRFDMHVLHSL